MKRLLSLALALVMLVLAVPVFALPLTAEADDATLNFYVGPTETNGMNTLGTLVSSTTVSLKQLPSDVQLADAGSTLTNADIVGWYTWNYAEDKFISVMDYLLGKRTATETLNFYPVTKDSTTVPLYKYPSGTIWIPGENQFLWSFEGEPVKGAKGTLGSFTGGWSFGSYVGNNYKTFDYIDYTSTWLLLRSDYTYQARGCAYIGRDGSWVKVASLEEVPAAEVLTYQAPVDGVIDVKLPYAYYTGTYAAVAVNGTVVWPEAVAGKTAAAPTAEDLKAWYQVPVDTDKVVNRATRYADANCIKVALDVSEGDRVQFLFASPDGTAGSQQYWYPAVEYTSDTTNIQNEMVAVSYYLSPTDSIGSASKGTLVASYERIKDALVALPTVEQMTSVGLNAEDVIGWYYWDAAEDTFREAKEYLEGIFNGLYPVPEEDLYFYPIMKDSTTVPLYLNGDNSIWILGENQPIIENGQLLAYTGGWSYGLWDDTGYQTLDTYKNGGLYAGENTTNYAVVSAESKFKTTTENATVLTYHATVAGKVTVRIPKAYTSFSLAFAKNDTLLWPKALEGKEASNSNASEIIGKMTGDYGWIGQWTGTDRTQRYQNVQATLSFDVEAGDRLYFMMYAANNASLWWYPQVVYETVYTAPSVSANLSVGSSLSVNTAVSVPEGLEEDVVERGVLVDGEKLAGTTIPVAAKEAGKNIVVQPYYVMESGVTVYGKKSVITVNKMLEEYIENGDEKFKAAAEATLDYTAAADAYFDDAAAAPEIVEPAGKVAYVEKSESIGVSEYEGEGKVEFRGISLLLNDLVNIKIVVDGTLPKGAELQIATNKNFTTPETVEGKATSDATGTKFIMDGISAENWNTDYYIRVADASGQAISDTLCYSVAAYYGHMIDRTEATDKLKAVISSLMNLYEAVSAAN